MNTFVLEREEGGEIMKRMLTVLAVALIMAAMVVAMAMPAFSAIKSVDTSCTNNGGHQPGGQQPTCQNSGGLTQQSENQNPAGHAPPGQNP
jgi:hypothetical protein